MKPIEDIEHHPVSERLVQILCSKTQNTNPLFFRVLVGYYFALVASMMRCKISTLDRGKIPVNLYAIGLSTSGSGKGLSTNVMEEQVINQFRDIFLEETFPTLAETNLAKISNSRATRKSVDPDEELERTRKEFEQAGHVLFSFDSATTAAVKQARHKLLMAKLGSVNLQIDEIGSNLLGNIDVLTTFLELFDVGKVKPKLVKNTSENIRHEEIPGRTPTNMMLFGTPSRLLNGGKAEDEFYSMLDTGYARRCFFGYSKGHARGEQLTAEEVYAQRIDNDTREYLMDISDRFADLADPIHANKELMVSKEVTLLFIEYQLACEKAAEALGEHEEMKKAELSHRHFKAIKLAGAYAFVDGVPEINMDHALSAIKLAEESGTAFSELLTRDRNYVKLAKFIANVKHNVTEADLVEDLPFYRGSVSQKQEMLDLAIAYGYQNNIIIKKMFNDGIKFLRGETLKSTNLERMKVSYSQDIAVDYRDDLATFDQLHLMTNSPGIHWVNHHLRAGHRQEDNAIPGFNLIVLDVEDSVSIEMAQSLLKDYKALYYTTKRHTPAQPRFRIVLPTNFELCLDAKDYKEFMNNLYEWLPFAVDTATNQRARKWMSHDDWYEYTEGELMDVLPFIPKTSKNEARRRTLDDQQSMDNLERWVINNTGDGNRNNQLLRYAMILVDAGFDFDGVRQRVVSLNDKIADKLEESEILGTIMVTVGKAIAKR